MLRVSVVDVAFTGCRIVLCSVVVVVVFVDGFCCTVVQADNAIKTAAARPVKIRFFMDLFNCSVNFHLFYNQW